MAIVHGIYSCDWNSFSIIIFFARPLAWNATEVGGPTRLEQKKAEGTKITRECVRIISSPWLPFLLVSTNSLRFYRKSQIGTCTLSVLFLGMETQELSAISLDYRGVSTTI